MRAIAAPVAVAASVFATILLISILSLVFRPDSPDLAGEPPSSDQQPALSAEPMGADEPPGAEGSTAPQQTIFVHVVGEVLAPGVFELAVGSRVTDAIAAAGGATSAAELAGVNLARRLGDGEQILVPNAEQAASAGNVQPSAAPGVVNINTADLATLETLPGVGPALAQRIVSWRETHGPFTDVEQLLDVSGIGAKTIEPLRGLVAV